MKTPFNIFQVIADNSRLANNKIQLAFIEAVLKDYLGEEKYYLWVEDLLEKDRENFGEIYFAKFDNIPIIKDINARIDQYDNIKTLSDVINLADKVSGHPNEKALVNYCANYEEELKKIEAINQELFLKFNNNRIEASLKQFEENLKDVKPFTLKQTREELGFTKQETFNQWLEAYFGTKYLNRNRNNGYLNFEEYLEIVRKFFLKFDESEFDLEKNIKIYKERLEHKLIAHSKDLRQIANHPRNFSNDVRIISEIHGIETPKGARIFPYHMASLLESEIPKLYPDTNQSSKAK
ncbi:hypothetical protein KZY98_10465 [Croceibacter atlanticus]|uniref:hypothetical protein n=1 Tax=Croceibacter atlanticus TaxID=313588 RepID=UPI001C600545|nr:hypothetical protein [Croceibacter atlanticus]MBW4970882.1 hypothetical protein [Croceibacter atlanticus]